MPSGASSTARDLDIRLAAPLEALYQVKPGRGRMPAVEPTLMMQPDLRERMCGTTAIIIVIDCLDVDIKATIKGGLVHAQQRLVFMGVASVVDDDVDLAKLLQSGVDHVVNVGTLADITFDGNSCRTDFPRHFLGAGFVRGQQSTPWHPHERRGGRFQLQNRSLLRSRWQLCLLNALNTPGTVRYELKNQNECGHSSGLDKNTPNWILLAKAPDGLNHLLDFGLGGSALVGAKT